MQADFSRRTFDRAKHFSAVLSQQGRVQLDADFNEQAAILLHQLRTVVTDLVGHAAAPEAYAGFAVEREPADATKKLEDLRVSPGRIYVDGILVENDLGTATDSSTWTSYWRQPDGYLDPENPEDRLPDTGPFVVYLRVWERLITALQDPAIREVALGDPGPDTAVRSKVVWQVAKFLVDKENTAPPAAQFDAWRKELNPNPGLLAARAKRPGRADEDVCDLPPEARFRGLENQLYRVEVHTGGLAWQDWTGDRTLRKDECGLSGATFKWSRENASVVFPIVSLSGAEVELATLGRDGKLALEVGDWVELVDDATASRVADDVLPSDEPVPAPSLRQVVAIDPADRRVTLDAEVAEDCGPGSRPELHPFLRRWDHASPTAYEKGKRDVAEDGALPLVEGQWIDLEDGVQVMFAERADPGTYRRGDYWQIPARTVPGDVEWPQDDRGPQAVPAHGVAYHYAALAVVTAAGAVTEPRPVFRPQVGSPAGSPVQKRVSSGSPKPRTAQSTRRSSGGSGDG
ncbi:DUF6519 domain-containing protein [Amycolatopsis anabasis]|uniref:DUF6519 domain-containing protein n=1 Tax=Amycolatopsis anabasis TaxID=1840409 RepID=UPI0015D3B793|nr:DUF6519 domain-containing protein [Amycolatopsis anabasis]